MNLNRIAPKEGFKWFMEFSCDSYDWVMHQNVFDMVFFVNGDSDNQTMRKPYISSSNYILKMSNYEEGEWSKIWDDLYYKFLKANKKKLWKYRYNYPILKQL
jgi:deoxyribodipyrimidine photolyase-related protein